MTPPALFQDLLLPTSLNTSSHDLIGDFFTPVLERAVLFDRGVGFFSSGWLRMASQGLLSFAQNGGRARWVTSPILSPTDWQALCRGDEARSDAALREALCRNVEDLQRALSEDTLSALAWMVADEVLTFRLALPHDKLDNGDFHDKFGVFTDAAGDQISFNGSYNDSIQGLRNYESIKVFRSWNPALKEWVDDDSNRFERLWENRDPNVAVFDIPEAIRAQILQLRTDQRPYERPAWVPMAASALPIQSVPSAQPRAAEGVTLRPYQEQAIESWFDHDCRGLFEMATGTGKTITALAASARLFEREKRLAVLIAVPFQHLVDQWNDQARAWGYEPILAYLSKSRWLSPLSERVREFNAGHRRFVSAIVTHDTFCSPDWEASIRKLNGPALLIADEAHHLGAQTRRARYPEHLPFRLALSATPDRYFDDVGTQALRSFFGQTVFSLPLKEAIGLSLTPYYYHPHLVPLSEEELDRYDQLTIKIGRLLGAGGRAATHEQEEALQVLLSQRADLLNRAENKLPVLSKLVDANGPIEHTLFYCAPKQIDEVTRLLGWEKGLQVHKFTHEEDAPTRKRLLSEFAGGELNALTAMRCLDEGVDVPGTRAAYFLASSSNPREFIQRRGRILRRAPGKDHAVIHDLIAVPPLNHYTAGSPTYNIERTIVRRELNRFCEFASCALNKHSATQDQKKGTVIHGIRRANKKQARQCGRLNN